MNFMKKIPTATIVLLLFALFHATWGYYQISLAKEYENISIVDIGNGIVSSENEGKNVCVTGKLEIVEPPTDDQMLFTANSVALIRAVEMYQYYISGDEVYVGFNSEQKYDIKGKKGEEYKNPSFPDDLRNEIFFAKAKIGDIVIGEEFLNRLVVSKVKTVDDDTEKTVERKYSENISLVDYKSCGDGYFTNGNPDEYEIGDLRVRFEYVDMDALGEVTICGCQKNGKLVPDEASFNEVFFSTSFDNIKEYCAKNDYKITGKVLFTVSGIMTLVGLSIYIIPIYVKKSKKEA